MNERQLPKYLLVKQKILEWLTQGRYKLDEMMPSENEISELFRVSRQTVRQTFSELENEGWLIRVQGKGTFVSNPQQFKTHHPMTVGVITTYISDYIFPHIVRGIEGELRSRGFRLLLASTDNNKEKEKEALLNFMNQPLSGLIIEPTKSAQGNPNVNQFLELQYRNIPFLMIHEKYPELSCPALMMNDELGGFLATEHLIQRGHRRIAGFFKTDDLQGVHRLKGFIRAHQHYQVSLSPDMVIQYDTENKFQKPSIYAEKLLQSSERPTACVCYNDELAIHLFDTVRMAGLRIPDDLSMIGYDDSLLATATEIKLTTIPHPKEEMGKDAASLLLQWIKNGEHDTNPSNKLYQPSIIIRNSTKNCS
jgi:GntR family transcriptional regulator of arabinose operon